jgi:hypothetical protein
MSNPVPEVLRPVRGSLVLAIGLQALAALAAVAPFVAIAEIGRRLLAGPLQTVLAADQILVLRDGMIAEHGRHDELIDAGGTYTEFWRQRTSAAGWRLV